MRHRRIVDPRWLAQHAATIHVYSSVEPGETEKWSRSMHEGRWVGETMALSVISFMELES